MLISLYILIITTKKNCLHLLFSLGCFMNSIITNAVMFLSACQRIHPEMLLGYGKKNT